MGAQGSIGQLSGRAELLLGADVAAFTRQINGSVISERSPTQPPSDLTWARPESKWGFIFDCGTRSAHNYTVRVPTIELADFVAYHITPSTSIVANHDLEHPFHTKSFFALTHAPLFWHVFLGAPECRFCITKKVRYYRYRATAQAR